MADKYYAWTNFVTKYNEYGQAVERVVPGDEVNASKLGMSDQDFQAYIDNGAVRTMPHPDMAGFSGSPAEWWRNQAARIGMGNYIEQMNQLSASPTPVEAQLAETMQAAPNAETTSDPSKQAAPSGKSS